MAVTVKLNRAGVQALLKDPRILADLRRRADAIARAAGEGHTVDAQIGRTRARAEVVTDTFEAKHAEATRRTLTSAIDAGR